MPPLRLAGCLTHLAASIPLLFIPPPSHATGNFSFVDSGFGVSESSGVALSADGATALINFVGTPAFGDLSYYRPAIWTSGTLLDLTPSGSGPNNLGSGLAADGSVVVGTHLGAGNNGWRYSNGTGMVTLNPLPTHVRSYTYGVSGDGLTAVGQSCSTGCATTEAVAWYNGGATPTQLAHVISGQVDGSAVGASHDGSVIVGTTTNGSGTRATYWKNGAGYDLGTLLDLPGANLSGNSSYANAVSADGSRVVGEHLSGSIDHAVLWTVTNPASPVIQDLGVLAGGTWSYAVNISADGNVVVGTAHTGGSGATGFRWTQATGMQSVGQWLAAAGVTVPVMAGAGIVNANATNADGSVVLGDYDVGGAHYHAYLARVVPAPVPPVPPAPPGGTPSPGVPTPSVPSSPGAGSGFIDLAAFNTSLMQAAGNAIQGGVQLPNLALFGAHHRSILDTGLARSSDGACAWATADGARYDKTRMRMELAEIGVCQDFEATRIGIGIGSSHANQAWSLGGSARYRGEYLVAELARDLGNDLQAAMTVYYGEFDTVLNRHYINGTAVATSTAQPNATSSALRFRVDWKNAFSYSDIAFSPYAAYAWLSTKLDAHTETGGGFPARFNRQQWDTSDLRFGVASKALLSTETTLSLAAEAVHRFEENTSGSSGHVLGLWNFSTPGRSVRSDWTRVTADIDHRLSATSLMTVGANFASTGGDASWGVTAGYRLNF